MVETEEEGGVRKLLSDDPVIKRLKLSLSELPGSFDPQDVQPIPFRIICPAASGGEDARGRIHNNEV